MKYFLILSLLATLKLEQLQIQSMRNVSRKMEYSVAQDSYRINSQPIYGMSSSVYLKYDNIRFVMQPKDYL